MSYQRSNRFPELYRKGAAVWWCFLPNPAGGRQFKYPRPQLTIEAGALEFLDWVRAPTGLSEDEVNSILDQENARKQAAEMMRPKTRTETR